MFFYNLFFLKDLGVLKEKIRSHLELPKESPSNILKLFFKGKPLNRDLQSIESYDITNFSTLTLEIDRNAKEFLFIDNFPALESSDFIQVFLHYLHETKSVRICVCDKVDQLEEQLFDLFRVINTRMVCSGVQLRKDMLLSCYNLKDGSNIQVVSRERGGSKCQVCEIETNNNICNKCER